MLLLLFLVGLPVAIGSRFATTTQLDEPTNPEQSGALRAPNETSASGTGEGEARGEEPTPEPEEPTAGRTEDPGEAVGSPLTSTQQQQVIRAAKVYGAYPNQSSRSQQLERLAKVASPAAVDAARRHWQGVDSTLTRKVGDAWLDEDVQELEGQLVVHVYVTTMVFRPQDDVPESKVLLYQLRLKRSGADWQVDLIEPVVSPVSSG